MSVRASKIRSAAVAGLFYPESPIELGASVQTFLSEASPESRPPKAVIAPHAGYIYSGPIAGKAYGSLGAQASLLRRVILIGPSHRVWFEGVAVPAAEAFATPLGELHVDSEALDRLRELPMVVTSDEPHALEHSLEVQLPFLQLIAPKAEIVPIVAGHASPSDVETVIASVWGGVETLIVVSSDLSHYQTYTTAQGRDASTAQAIVDGRDDLTGEQACGCVAINGLTRVAAKRGMHTKILDLRNSGDTAGDKRRVVGYGAFGFYDA
jgi:AmmeMemoRadiSam system protein B